MATTTSLHDSGLLAELLPVFESERGIHVRLIAVGSGAALAMGERGDADLLLTHDPAGERRLVERGFAVARRPFMENHFVIVGPPGDPAAVAEAADPAEALRRIVRSGVPWVSRGDDSGTHRRERALLAEAGLPEEGGWEGFTSAGTGMGLTLQVAGERRAYTLSDIGTFLSFRDRVGLVALSDEAPALRNVYSVLRVDPESFEERVIRAEPARALEEFLLSRETAARIARFGRERFGRPLFRPLVEPAPPEAP